MSRFSRVEGPHDRDPRESESHPCAPTRMRKASAPPCLGYCSSMPSREHASGSGATAARDSLSPATSRDWASAVSGAAATGHSDTLRPSPSQEPASPFERAIAAWRRESPFATAAQTAQRHASALSSSSAAAHTTSPPSFYRPSSVQQAVLAGGQRHRRFPVPPQAPSPARAMLPTAAPTSVAPGSGQVVRPEVEVVSPEIEGAIRVEHLMWDGAAIGSSSSSSSMSSLAQIEYVIALTEECCRLLKQLHVRIWALPALLLTVFCSMIAMLVCESDAINCAQLKSWSHLFVCCR